MPEWVQVTVITIWIVCGIGTAIFIVLAEIEMRKIRQLMKPRDKDKTH